MKFSTKRAANEDRTKSGNLRKKAKQLLESVEAQRIPPATPARPRTGLDEHGQSRADSQGNVYRLHAGKHPTLREARRANRFGRFTIQPMRSRIQRAHRKQRTGGIK